MVKQDRLKQRQQRKSALLELVQTENDYVNYLFVLYQNYYLNGFKR